MLQYSNSFLPILGFLVIDAVLLGKEDRRRFLALVDLLFSFGGLLVGHPSWISADEGERVHAEDQNVDASVIVSCD